MAQLKLKQLDSVLTGSLVVSGSQTITGSLYVSESIYGDGLVLGEEAYSLGATYVGLKTSFQTGSNDYMIISGKSDGSTYISAKDNSGVEIRGGGNRSNNSIIIPDDTYIKLGGSATTLLRPEDDNTIDLGSSAKRFKDLVLSGHVTASGNISSSGNITGSDIHAGGNLSFAGGTITGPANDHFDMRSGKNVRVYLDDDANSSFCKFTVMNGDEDVVFSIAESGKATIGEAVTATHQDGLTVVGGVSGSYVSASGDLDIGNNALIAGNLQVNDNVTFGNATSDKHTFIGHITASGNISASGTIYADNFTSTGGDVAGISFADDLNITGHITSSGDINTTAGRVYEAGTSVIDHATAMAIVFGG